MEQTKIAEIINITKEIGDKKIVKDLSLNIYSGEIFGFLGPNGAGKTTTIRMMVGLMKMSQGDILIKGYSIKNNFKKAIKNVGGIIENPDLYKYLTGYQNLTHYARMSKNINKSRIDEVIKIVGLDKSIHEKVETYSLGMRQRLGIAQAILHQPSLLILDEPTNGLDPEGIHELRDYLKKLAHEEGVSIFVSSHLLAEIEQMCDRVGVLKNGKLINIQKIKGNKDATENSYVNFTIGSNQVEEAKLLISSYKNMEFSKSAQGELFLNMNEKDIPILNKAFVDNDINIYRIELHKKSLEDRFLEITKEEM